MINYHSVKDFPIAVALMKNQFYSEKSCLRFLIWSWRLNCDTCILCDLGKIPFLPEISGLLSAINYVFLLYPHRNLKLISSRGSLFLESIIVSLFYRWQHGRLRLFMPKVSSLLFLCWLTVEWKSWKDCLQDSSSLAENHYSNCLYPYSFLSPPVSPLSDIRDEGFPLPYSSKEGAGSAKKWQRGKNRAIRAVLRAAS